jgi:hypothetical protein
MEPDLFFERQQWRQWLAMKPRFATDVIAEFVERARACTRLDQATFAAALFEAIWGRAPSRGQEPVPPTRRQGVPAWVLPTLVRGLSDDPRLCFPSTRALLDALDRNTFGRRSELMFVSA